MYIYVCIYVYVCTYMYLMCMLIYMSFLPSFLLFTAVLPVLHYLPSFLPSFTHCVYIYKYAHDTHIYT